MTAWLLISLAATDAPTSMALPMQALAGKYHLWSSPHSLLAICGAIRPMKPMTPTRATASEASTLTRNSAPRRMRCGRSEEHTSELQSLMRISYAVFSLKKKKKTYTVYIQQDTIRKSTISITLQYSHSQSLLLHHHK